MSAQQVLLLIDVDGVALPLVSQKNQITKKHNNNNYYFSEYFIKLIEFLKDKSYIVKWFTYWEEETKILNKILNVHWSYIPLINDKAETLSKIITTSHEKILLIDDEYLLTGSGDVNFIHIDGDTGINEEDYKNIDKFLKSVKQN